MKPLYWLFAWFIAAIAGKMATDRAREWWRDRRDPR